MDENFEQSPSLSRSSRVAPRGWPAKAVRKEVALGGNSSDAKASASKSIPLPINEGAVAVPRDILRASDVVGEGDNPGKGASRLPRRDGNPDSKQAMKLEVPEPTIRNLIPHETGGGRRGGPPFRGAGAVAGKSVVKGADRVKAQLAPIVVSPEGRNRGFPGL